MKPRRTLAGALRVELLWRAVYGEMRYASGQSRLIGTESRL